MGAVDDIQQTHKNGWNVETEINDTVEPRLSRLVGTSVKSPDNRESG